MLKKSPESKLAEILAKMEAEPNSDSETGDNRHVVKVSLGLAHSRENIKNSPFHFLLAFLLHFYAVWKGRDPGHEWRFERAKVFKLVVFIVTKQFISIFQAMWNDWNDRVGQNSSFLLAKEEKLLWWYLFHAWLKLNRILFLFSFHEGLTPDQIGKTRVACFSEGNEKESLGELEFGGIKFLEALWPTEACYLLIKP